METKQKTLAKEHHDVLKELLEVITPVPPDQFTHGTFINNKGKCCSVGHYLKAKHDEPLLHDTILLTSQRMVTLKIEQAARKAMDLLDLRGELNVYDINDHHEYRGNNPKERMVNFLTDALELPVHA